MRSVLITVLGTLLLLACSLTGPPSPPTPTPDIYATVEAAVLASIPIPTPDIPATVEAAVRAAMPTPTPDIPATVQAGIAATIAAQPTPTPTPTPDPAVVFAQMVQDARDSVVRISHDQGVGSGVIFEVAAGTAAIATNHHVVEGHTTVNVTVGDRDTYTGFVRGTDTVQDIAVVAICCGDFRALPFANPAAVRVGDEIVLMGYALDLRGEATLTRGVISAIRFSDSHQSMVIQTDAAMNPGNSGGPMLNVDGEIVGINTFGISVTRGGRSVEGLGFAISVETVRPRALYLKTQIAPVPTPTPTPRPTPTPQSVRLFGPQDVALPHDPYDGHVKTWYAGVDMGDGVVTATFTNPYTAWDHRWSHGLYLGKGPDSTQLVFYITSRGGWRLKLYSKADGWEELASGYVRLNPVGSGLNSMIVRAEDGLVKVFVNGARVHNQAVSTAIYRGDVAVATGIWTGSEREGAVTRVTRFQIDAL